MDLGIQGKTALVAAASDGLGKAVALRLAAEGAHIVICARNAERLQSATAEIQSANPEVRVNGFETDLSLADDIEQLGTQLEHHDLNIDILVNNAGGPPPGSCDDVADEQWRQAFDLTMMSTVRLTRLALGQMRAQRWGRIINITSYSVKQPMPQMVLSNSIRMGVIGWAKTLSNEVASDGITVNNVCPGWTRTGRVDQLLRARSKETGIAPEEIQKALIADIPSKRMGEVAEFADVVAFLASARASYVTGTTLPVDGGAVRAAM
ncbi:MAG: SDR family oxidoreductase [Candidatus Binatia bacterium]|nr:SDR family oxidoreductase [Candidatus Binatia bacterium]MDG1401400.1 SDR family oxidoreductase [Candidatus Binatia bacterium]MDG1957977.1 SDR family oxidoreductase [Candidatus Binatia bacterium]MDG2009596.1 SDR family oxidoreductase [Candidatus Binatia bacterium]